MASDTRVKKHTCSCGRTFRHAISLKRHRKVSGCDVAESTNNENSSTSTKSPKPSAKTTKKVADKSVPTVECTPSLEGVVITPELVAQWQTQIGFNDGQTDFIDSLGAPKVAPKEKIDWVALMGTVTEFFTFCGEAQRGLMRSLQSGIVILGRAALFVSVLFFASWSLVAAVSANDASPTTLNPDQSRLAAQTVVENFLQNARLGQYQRAQQQLTPSAQGSVTVDQLESMLRTLPLDVAPTAFETELSHDYQQARVTVSRDGFKEVYRLTLSEQGWGVASVSVNS